LIHLLQHADYDAQKLDEVLNKASGLKGISGVSGDLRQILSDIDKGNERAKLAFDMYVHSLCKNIGAMLATLGGLDALVFTGGVGENAPAIRGAACEAFGFLGLKLDIAKNDASPADTDIAAEDSVIRVFVVHTEEDWAIAQECWKLAKTSSFA
jgi:acetate kinase